MIDIDHFKKFNDTYGHQQGDMVLKEVARLIKVTVRESDIAARYGGEEMSVILPATDTDTAYEIAERLRKSIEKSKIPGASRWNKGYNKPGNCLISCPCPDS